MRIKFSFIALLLYITPALTSYFAVHWLDGELQPYAVWTIYFSAFSAFAGYLCGNKIHRINIAYPGRWNIPLVKLLAYTLLIVAIFSCALNFIRIGSFPLFSGNIERLKLWGSPLWNLMIAGSSGAFLTSWIKSTNHSIRLKFGWILISIYLLLVLLTGWKGVFIFSFMMVISPHMKTKSIGISVVLKYTALFLLLFYTVNALRSDFTPWDAPLYYIYWGFVNFSDLGIQSFDNCFYSLPVFGCRFSVGPNELVIPTWNVFTALTPLYLDGGIFLVGLFFFCAGYLLAWSSKRFNSIVSDYIFFMMTYLFFFSHNGYIFDSSSYLFVLFLFGCITLVAKKTRQSQIYS